ncbi:MAG: transcriptional repressor [Spirochaetaceae bacterium]|nr:transcriptional repressor [Spirochaetaceae bacterium]
MQQKTYAKNTGYAILAYLSEQVSFPVSAQCIYEHLRKQGSKVNLTTVYRQLEKLTVSGKVLPFLAEDGSTKVYQLNTGECDSHLHLRCAVCGKLDHLDCNEVTAFLEHIQKNHHVRVNCNSSILFGVCDDCARKCDS